MDIRFLVNWSTPVKVVKGQVQITDVTAGGGFIPEKIRGTVGGSFKIGVANGKPPNPVTLAGATAPKEDGAGLMPVVTTSVERMMGGDFPPQCQYEPDKKNRTILSQQLSVTFTWPDKSSSGDTVTLQHPRFATFVTDKDTEKGGPCAKQ